jgi:hypothetical protein
MYAITGPSKLVAPVIVRRVEIEQTSEVLHSSGRSSFDDSHGDKMGKNVIENVSRFWSPRQDLRGPLP